jgi:hypothetical protein
MVQLAEASPRLANFHLLDHSPSGPKGRWTNGVGKEKRGKNEKEGKKEEERRGNRLVNSSLKLKIPCFVTRRGS